MLMIMSFVRFLGEVRAPQFCFEINWPLGDHHDLPQPWTLYSPCCCHQGFWWYRRVRLSPPQLWWHFCHLGQCQDQSKCQRKAVAVYCPGVMQPCYGCYGYCYHLHEVVSFDCFGFGRHHVANLEKKETKDYIFGSLPGTIWSFYGQMRVPK